MSNNARHSRNNIFIMSYSKSNFVTNLHAVSLYRHLLSRQNLQYFDRYIVWKKKEHSATISRSVFAQHRTKRSFFFSNEIVWQADPFLLLGTIVILSARNRQTSARNQKKWWGWEGKKKMLTLTVATCKELNSTGVKVAESYHATTETHARARTIHFHRKQRPWNLIDIGK